jgi:Anti-sigma factor NepR
VTDFHTSPTVTSLNLRPVRGAQRSMAKAYKSCNFDSDPVAAALKQMYVAVASEALPVDFLRLLEQIDTKIAAKKVAH